MCVDDVEYATTKGRTVLYEPHFVTDPGAMANGADASWIKGTQSTYGPGAQQSAGNIVADDFTLTSASTINEIEVYGYQTGSSTQSTFTGLYAVIYDGNPMSGGQIVWGDMNTNIMTSTSFTNAYRGNGDASGTTRPIMALTASNLNIALEAGTYYLAWNMTGSGSSGPWGQPEAYPTVGNSGNGVQYQSSSSSWLALADSGSSEPYGLAFKLVGEGGGPTPPQPVGDVLAVNIYRDGEFLVQVPASITTLTDMVEEGTYEYCIQVIYSDYGMSCGDKCVEVEVGPAVCDPVTGLTAVSYSQGGNDGVLMSWNAPAGAVVSYGIYIDGELLGNTPNTSVFIYNFEPGTYTLGVTAVYANCESEMVTTTWTYAAVGEETIVSAIYPNPTSGDLHINATAMTHVSVFNAMGQMVYDQAVDADELTLNMSQYEAGVYMVRIDTENGSSVKRITVVK